MYRENITKACKELSDILASVPAEERERFKIALRSVLEDADIYIKAMDYRRQLELERSSEGKILSFTKALRKMAH